MTLSAKLEDAVTGQCEMVLVPRVPTGAMLKAGWAEAHEENAEGVWSDMIETWELERSTLQLVKYIITG